MPEPSLLGLPLEPGTAALNWLATLDASLMPRETPAKLLWRFSGLRRDGDVGDVAAAAAWRSLVDRILASLAARDMPDRPALVDVRCAPAEPSVPNGLPREGAGAGARATPAPPAAASLAAYPPASASSVTSEPAPRGDDGPAAAVPALSRSGPDSATGLAAEPAAPGWCSMSKLCRADGDGK